MAPGKVATAALCIAGFVCSGSLSEAWILPSGQGVECLKMGYTTRTHTHTYFLWTLQLFSLMHMKLTVPPEFNLPNCRECKWRDLLEPLTGFFWSTKDRQVGLNPRPVSLLPLLPSASSLNSAPCYQSYPHSSFPLASLNPHTLHHLQCPFLVNAVVPLRYHSMLWES